MIIMKRMIIRVKTELIKALTMMMMIILIRVMTMMVIRVMTMMMIRVMRTLTMTIIIMVDNVSVTINISIHTSQRCKATKIVKLLLQNQHRKWTLETFSLLLISLLAAETIVKYMYYPLTVHTLYRCVLLACF